MFQVSTATLPQICQRWLGLQAGKDHRSPIQRIPSRLLLGILNRAVHPVEASHLIKFTHQGSLIHPSEAKWDFDATDLRESRKNALTLTLVCRDWYLIGTEILYSRPFLDSDIAIERFYQTVKARPQICRLVRDLYLDRIHTLNFQTRLHPGSTIIHGIGTYYRLKRNIDDIITYCSDIKSILTVGDDGAHTVTSLLLNRILDIHNPPLSLRQLILHVDKLHNLRRTSGLTFPTLEVLSLRQGTIHHRAVADLASFPRLRTLQLAHIILDRSDLATFANCTREVAPFLNTLQVFEVSFRNVEYFTMRLPNIFENLTLVGPRQLQCFMTKPLAASTDMQSVRHLVVGVVSSPALYIADQWRIPESLESLTVFVNIPDDDVYRLRLREQNVMMLDMLRDCFHNNLTARGEKLSLREVVLNLSNYPPCDPLQRVLVDAALYDIEALCETWNIMISVRALDIEIWATEQLSVHLTKWVDPSW
ncbi:hypothetical protein K474DRAFT_1440692 [Panus rudis PR-1116 ss-1]|nr:hypothetical protein K474DRAFT_1440692 [Panus rudis PR-1116 ss-1]